MTTTSIEWVRNDDGSEGKVWNCLRGCSRISPGCGGASGVGGCYAEAIAGRFSGPNLPFYGFARRNEKGQGRWTGKVELLNDKLFEPFSWRKPTRCFANSMSDLFHERFTNEEIAAVFGVMLANPHITFQCLTKRAARMPEWFAWVTSQRGLGGLVMPDEVCVEEACSRDHSGRFKMRLHRPGGWPWPAPNVHLGVSVENQECANERIPQLLTTPASVRWLSCEPLLGRIGLRGDWLLRRPHVDWIVVGSESGRGARPMELAWARAIVDYAMLVGCPVFTKQIATPGHPKGGDPAFWPAGVWPRQFPEARS